jgi:hypothetical protein
MNIARCETAYDFAENRDGTGSFAGKPAANSHEGRLLRMAALAMGLCAVSACSPWRTPTLPVASSVELEQVVIYSDFELSPQHRLLTELEDLRDRVASRLSLVPSEKPIHVYLFKTQRRYRAFMREHFPEYPNRRALFVETDTQLNVYAQWGDNIAEDLRHEVCHGYMHAMVPHLPLWLDEGLAEYFEVDSSAGGLNRAHLQHLLASVEAEHTWRPDIRRLEQLDSMADMGPTEYAESWAWVHFLLHSTAPRRQLLLDHIQQMRSRRPDMPLSQVIAKADMDPAQQLRQHLIALNDSAIR